MANSDVIIEQEKDYIPYSEFIKGYTGYDDRKDISPVTQFGFVDIGEVMKTGVIPSTLQASAPSFNNFDDPDSFSKAGGDIFEMYRNVESHSNADSTQ